MPTPKNGQWLNQPSAKQANQISLLTQEPLCDSTMSPIGEGGIKLLTKPDQSREEASVLWFSFLLLNNRCPVLIKKKKKELFTCLQQLPCSCHNWTRFRATTSFFFKGPDWTCRFRTIQTGGLRDMYLEDFRLKSQPIHLPRKVATTDMTNGCCSLRPIVARRTQ